MLTYKDILYATTKILSDNFKCDVIVENKEGIFENECFYVNVIPTNSTSSTKTSNKKQIMLSIKYFGGSKLDNYDIADKLECLFVRNIKVKNRFLNISSVEPNFLTDEVGDMLDFLIYITYFDEASIEKQNYENMNDISIEI